MSAGDPKHGGDRVALATCRELPAGDEDAARLVAALAARSIDAGWFVWNDPALDWSAFGLSVIRSTWDYTGDRAAFLDWAATTPRLYNPAPVLAWNSDKTYLRDLVVADLPTVATEWIEPGHSVALPGVEFVLKPSVGAGSKGAGRFDPAHPHAADAARRHAAALHAAGRTVMVQPYLGGVDTTGEAALIYFGGRFSHAITKRALLAPGAVHALEAAGPEDLFVLEQITARSASPAEREIGERVLSYLSDRFGALLYTRVDLLPAASGPVVIEVELTEPSLFLSYDDGSADRFAAAIADRLRAA